MKTYTVVLEKTMEYTLPGIEAKNLQEARATAFQAWGASPDPQDDFDGQDLGISVKYTDLE